MKMIMFACQSGDCSNIERVENKSWLYPELGKAKFYPQGWNFIELLGQTVGISTRSSLLDCTFKLNVDFDQGTVEFALGTAEVTKFQPAPDSPTCGVTLFGQPPRSELLYLPSQAGWSISHLFTDHERSISGFVELSQEWRIVRPILHSFH